MNDGEQWGSFEDEEDDKSVPANKSKLKTELQLAKQSILYCGTRENTLLKKAAFNAQHKYYNFKVRLLKSELNILRAKLSPDSTRTKRGFVEGERYILEQEINRKQTESHKYRDWIRHNKEFNKYEY